MTGRPLIAIVTLAALVGVATVGLEAVGVLFPPEDMDANSRVEAFLAGLGADTESMVAPSQPVDLPQEATAREPVWYDAEPSAPAEAVPTREPVAAEDTTAPAGEADMPALFAMTIPPPAFSPEAVPDEEPSPMEQLSAPWPPPPPTAAPMPEPAVIAPVVRTVDAPLPPRQRLARSGRIGSAHTTGAGGFGCPVLDWLIP
jgi:hypothetical protein